MSKGKILKVAVNVPLSRLFDYLPPQSGPAPQIGCRVIVPFGRRRETGVVFETAAESALPAGKLRQAYELLEPSPLLGPAELHLIRFTSEYYHHPIGEVMAAALPTLLRQGKALHPTVESIAVRPAGENVDIEALRRRAPRQEELLSLLLDAGGDGLDTDTLTELLPHWRRAAKALREKGWVESLIRAAADFDDEPGLVAQPGPELNADQRTALTRLREQATFSVKLIDGVTGSGKTEVYQSRMQDVLAEGKQVLVLVPEIGLTPQLVGRFRRRLGLQPALLHSGLSDIERLAAWRAARSGAARLVVGTRSAVFTPLARPGLIIVDEEHDQSFKQQEGLRYSARDLAIARARHFDIPIVLGTATPTLEMLQHCRNGKYGHIVLPRRAGAAQPPQMRLIDTSRSPAVDGVSAELARAIDTHLKQDGQVLLYLNRRGYAPTLICSACSHIAECRRCDSRMTVHASARLLRCHHCGSQRPLNTQCDECAADVQPLGEGTERLEDALTRRFPGHRVLRIDSDSTQRKGAMLDALAQASDGRARLLVGTQMLSKGHHFPELTLVGIVNADQGLFGSDFRSAERLAQSIVQVAGRAGRESKAGEVLIQTAFPEHTFWATLRHGGYAEIADEALLEREKTRWPPFTRLALLRAAAHNRADAIALLDEARALVSDIHTETLRALGPVDAPMARRAGRHRVQLLLQASDRRELHTVLNQLRPALEQLKSARKVRWSIDVDPIELF